MSITPTQLAEKRDSLKKAPSVERAIEVIADAEGFNPLARGKIKFDRTPGPGTKGELWLRNSLAWLKTIPLQPGHCFVNLHAESPIYLTPSGGRSFSADLLGLSYRNNGARFCAVELKYGASGDNLVYAITEGAVNLVLSRKNLPALLNHWKQYSGARAAWRAGNPFAGIKKSDLVILGDYSWIEANRTLKTAAGRLIRQLKQNLGIDTFVFYFAKGVKPGSKPYRLLSVNRLV